MREFNPRALYATITLVSAIEVVLGVGVLISNSRVTSLLQNWYADFLPVLLPNMMDTRTPVGTFATHSIASFYFVVLCIFNIRLFSQQRRKVNLAMAVGLVVVLANMGHSLSALVFLVILGLWCISPKRFPRAGRVYVIALAFLLLLSSIAAIRWAGSLQHLMSGRSLSLSSRYSSTSGNLASSVDRVLHNPIAPLGLRTDNSLFIGDSGFLVLSLRGGIAFAFVAYYQLSRFLRHWLGAGLWIGPFLVFMLFEIGIPDLVEPRLLAMLIPMAVVYRSLSPVERPSGIRPPTFLPGASSPELARQLGYPRHWSDRTIQDPDRG
jgi:uncharacterized membrane protein YqjE